VVEGLLAVLPVVARRHEVIVVDDGSCDGTAAAVPAAAAVRVLRHATSRGYGSALRTGFAAAREPWLFFTDGDGQFDVRDLPRVVAAAGDADLVAGYRAPRADPLGRRLCGRAWTALVRLTLGVRVRDVNCAFKLLRRDVLAAGPLESAGALVNAELLGKAVRQGFRVRQVAVSHHPRRHGRASGWRPRVVWGALRELVVLRGRIRGAAPAAGGQAASVRRSRQAAVLGLAPALLFLAAAAGAGDVGRYRFSSRADAGTFVLDTETGRVWRYDRVDDAWYRDDLAALVGKNAHGRKDEPPPVAPQDVPAEH
jgi:hypothetical protein